MAHQPDTEGEEPTSTYPWEGLEDLVAEAVERCYTEAVRIGYVKAEVIA